MRPVFAGWLGKSGESIPTSVYFADLDYEIPTFVAQELGTQFTNVHVHETIILGHNPTPSSHGSRIKTAHASGAAITIVRIAEGTVQGATGYLRLYPTSHHQTMGQFNQYPPAAAQPALHPGQLLIMLGNLKWEIVPPRGCLLVIKSYSVKKMLSHCLSPYTLPFMTFTTCHGTQMDSILTITETYTRDLSPEEILSRVKSDFGNIEKFLKHDFSAIILKFRPGPADNIRSISLRPKHTDEHTWEVHLRQILGSKSLALSERQWLSQRDLDPEVDSPVVFGQSPLFLKMGRTLDLIERRVGIPGISFMWIPLFPLFRHWSRRVVEEIIGLLLSTYHDVVKQSQRHTSDVLDYQVWFQHLLGACFLQLHCCLRLIHVSRVSQKYQS